MLLSERKSKMNMNNSALRLVQFYNEKTEFEGFTELSQAGQEIRKVKGRQYVISSRQCALLTERGIKYKILKPL